MLGWLEYATVGLLVASRAKHPEPFRVIVLFEPKVNVALAYFFSVLVATTANVIDLQNLNSILAAPFTL